MSRFNDNISVFLEPLTKDNTKVVVHYPLFANTYTLPFFYSEYLKQKNKTKEIPNLIKKCDWGKDIFREIDKIQNDDKNVHIFFATDETKNSLGKNVTEYAKNKDFNNDVQEVDFCKYYPRFVFLDFSIDTFVNLYCTDDKGNIDYEKIPQYNYLSNFITEHFLLNIPCLFEDDSFQNMKSELKAFFQNKKIQIFTDTENEAVGLQMMLEKALSIDNSQEKITINYGGNENPILKQKASNANTINLYFYSAPYNMLFLSKKYKYIPLRIRDDNNSSDENAINNILSYFDTKCYVITKDMSKDVKLLNDIGDKLREFFEYIFWKAKETPEHFYNITQSYNALSAIYQPTITFDDEYCFAKCLSLHISPKRFTKIETDNATKDKNQLSKRLLFESVYSHSHNTKYNQRKIELLEQNIQQIYSLIVLNYLLNDIEKIHSFNNKIFSSVCQALENTDFNYDFYGKLMDNFISYQAQILMNEFKDKEGNPIYDAVNTWKIDESKIKQRLIYEAKRYFYDTLIKECKAEAVFYISKKKDKSTKERIFEIDNILKKEDENDEIKKSIEFIKTIFANTLEICADYFDDIVKYEIFGLSAIFGNNVVARRMCRGGSMPTV